ncbi:MAG: hypothetical protein JW874_11310 [Spirochaetales bacterium]|nr:hypothetical protein [Spirochaetales bacterium]
MDVLLRNQKIQRRFRVSRRDRKSRQSISDFRSLRVIPVNKKNRSESFLGTLFFSARPLLINMIGFILLVVVFLLLSGNPADVSGKKGTAGLSATLSQPVESVQDSDPTRE